jgi:hypothetical protein
LSELHGNLSIVENGHVFQIEPQNDWRQGGKPTMSQLASETGVLPCMISMTHAALRLAVQRLMLSSICVLILSKITLGQKFTGTIQRLKKREI